MTVPGPDRIYSNSGNVALMDLLDEDYRRILDVGCGAGDNAAILKARRPSCQVSGITHSAGEAALAERYVKRCWVFDVEGPLPAALVREQFDVLIFSHVLEHVRHPATVLARFVNLLRAGGVVLIAVPNILSWRMRIAFCMGRFEYGPAGVLDDTHLRFFTFHTADRLLVQACRDLTVVSKGVSGSVPLWVLRRHILSQRQAAGIDRWASRRWPNLFGSQVLIKAVKADET